MNPAATNISSVVIAMLYVSIDSSCAARCNHYHGSYLLPDYREWIRYVLFDNTRWHVIDKLLIENGPLVEL